MKGDCRKVTMFYHGVHLPGGVKNLMLMGQEEGNKSQQELEVLYDDK